MVHGKNRIPYWIDRSLTGLAGPDDDATISFGLPIEPENSQYGEYRILSVVPSTLTRRPMFGGIGATITLGAIGATQDGVGKVKVGS